MADNGLVRDPKSGRFLKGHPGGPGNPEWRIHAEFRAAVGQVATPAKVRSVLRWLYKEAAQGNVHAMREFLDRTVGKPVSAADHEDAARQVFAGMLTEIFLELIARAPDSKAAASHVRIMRDVIGEKAARIVEVEGGADALGPRI